MLKCGLLGRKLGHSYSPAIHKELGDYEYRIYEKEPEELEDFILNGDWNGLNVTIPYKKAVPEYCDSLSETARRIGTVNTLVKRPDRTIFGDNTDVYGFASLVRVSGIDPCVGKVLVLGSGGASAAVLEALRQVNVTPIVISRSGANNYTNIERHADASLIINTTPLGMYPNTGVSPVDLNLFPRLKGVLDVVYNPARTQILLDAEARGIPNANGLYMLTAQAKKSSECFTGSAIPDGEIDRVTRKLAAEMMNIVIIGMPGSGKTVTARRLAERTGREAVDADAFWEEKYGERIQDFIHKMGEAAFRERETEVLTELGKRSGIIISAGGGVVTREENYPLLHQNGTIVRIERDIDRLARAGRPLSIGNDLHAMYAVRAPLYERFADITVSNNSSLDQTVNEILKKLKTN